MGSLATIFRCTRRDAQQPVKPEGDMTRSWNGEIDSGLGDTHRLSAKERAPMTPPCIICVAITGSVPQKTDNPAVPISVAEQVESAHEAFEAGACILHAHVRRDDGTPCSDPDLFARLKEQVERHCPGMIIQFSTGGRSGSGAERGGMLYLAPDMASLAVGSNNFPTRVYENPPQLVDDLAALMRDHDIKPEIEAFDLSHIFQAVKMQADGRLKGPLHIQFVMGVKNAMPVDKPVFDFYVETVRRLAPDATWCGAGIGRDQITLNEWSIAAGGHTRTGLEDNIRLGKHTLAPSNAALVARTVDLCARYDRRPATWAEARKILGLRMPG
jgi:3-keto-5-aminohexanoate cleavage enzyme